MKPILMYGNCQIDKSGYYVQHTHSAFQTSPNRQRFTLAKAKPNRSFHLDFSFVLELKCVFTHKN